VTIRKSPLRMHAPRSCAAEPPPGQPKRPSSGQAAAAGWGGGERSTCTMLGCGQVLHERRRRRRAVCQGVSRSGVGGGGGGLPPDLDLLDKDGEVVVGDVLPLGDLDGHLAAIDRTAVHLPEASFGGGAGRGRLKRRGGGRELKGWLPPRAELSLQPDVLWVDVERHLERGWV